MTALIPHEPIAMPTKPKKLPKPKTASSANAKLTSQSIAEQTRAFLEGGGRIVKVGFGAREEIDAKKV